MSLHEYGAQPWVMQFRRPAPPACLGSPAHSNGPSRASVSRYHDSKRLVSAVLYHYIEIPGMDMGRSLIRRLARSRELTKEKSALQPALAVSALHDKG